MEYDAAIFDLDGTLADTLADIAAAGNHAMRELGRAEIELPRYRYLAGQGVARLVADALGEDADPEKIEQGVHCFRVYYEEHWRDQTGPYPGVPEMLDALSERGIKLAVLSNKPHWATVEVVGEFFGQWPFDAVVGHRPEAELKPHPGSGLAVAERLGVAPDRCVYVGDTAVDMQTGRSAGFFTVGVTWGFRDESELRDHGAQAIIHTPMELTGWF